MQVDIAIPGNADLFFQLLGLSGINAKGVHDWLGQTVASNRQQADKSDRPVSDHNKVCCLRPNVDNSQRAGGFSAKDTP